MIQLQVTAINTQDLHQQLAAILIGANATLAANGVAAPVAEEQALPEKSKATRATKAKAEPAKQDTEAMPEPGPTATTDVSPSDITPESLRERATKYSAQAGPIALTEMQKAAGAPNGKMSEIIGTADGTAQPNPEAMAKYDALLADAGY